MPLPARKSPLLKILPLLAATCFLSGPAHAEDEAAAEPPPASGGLFENLIRKLARPDNNQPQTSDTNPATPSGGTHSLANDESLVREELRPPPGVGATIDLTAETDNLWQRIRNGFAMPNLNNDLVLTHQQWYLAKPEYLRQLVERSRPFMHYIVEELERRGMPTELALLPMVESSYNPMALSRAQASGLWQFIPATGKRYNLEQNWWHDQRRDIIASTNAALDYLQAIYDMNGDWHLALASYNWGEGAVKRAVEKNALRGQPTDYASLNMPNETRHYVPKLQALKNIFSNPSLMVSLRLPELLNRPQLAIVEANRPIDITTAAKLAEMPVDKFVALNPAHNRPVIKGERPLVIPAEKLETFQNNLEQHEQQDRPLSNWQTYTLKPGEKLDKLAPRFGIALNDLKRVNGLHGGLRISPGSTLLVPAANNSNGNDLNAMPDSPIIPDLTPPAPPPRLAKIEKAPAGKAASTPAVKTDPKANAGNKAGSKTAAKTPSTPKGNSKGAVSAPSKGTAKPSTSSATKAKSPPAGTTTPNKAAVNKKR